MARRAVTNTPQQALVGLNEPGMHAAAQDLAKRLAKRGSDAAKVEQAFWICFSRPPDALERAKCLEFVKQQRLAKREVDGTGRGAAQSRRKVDPRMNAPNGRLNFGRPNTPCVFGRAAGGFGALALGCLLREQGVARPARPHFAPRAKRVISLFMSGGPSHVDTFDPKPLLTKLDGQPMPADIIRNHEFAMIKTREPKVKGSPWKFRPHGQSGIEISELFPHVAGVADELAIVRSLYSDTFNHDPAVTFMNTGNVRFGWPSLGAWASYGLGTENSDLPAYIVLASGRNIQPLLDSYWGAGFLPPEHQGVPLRTQGDPVLYLKNPTGSVARPVATRSICWARSTVDGTSW